MVIIELQTNQRITFTLIRIQLIGVEVLLIKSAFLTVCAQISFS